MVRCGWSEAPAVWVRFLRLEASECGTHLKADTAVWGTLPAALYLDPDGLAHHGRGARVRDP